MADILTLGAVADRFNVHVWQVRRLYERKILPEPGRAGPFRIVTPADLPAIEAALRKCGYLREEGPVNAA